MNIHEAKKQVMKFYGGGGWSSAFTFIRLFLTAPFDRLEPHIPQCGYIIDLGTGYGIFANLIGLLSKERKVLGVDLDEYKIRHAYRGVDNVEFQLGDIAKIDIPQADCILLIHVLHHLDSPQAHAPLLQTCVGRLKQGGKLIIAEIDRRPWWKFILGNIADRILYKFRRPYYRYPESMLPLLEALPLQVTSEAMHQGTPFSHITYICTKR
jgi:SAM-dependent methyltransferase